MKTPPLTPPLLSSATVGSAASTAPAGVAGPGQPDEGRVHAPNRAAAPPAHGEAASREALFERNLLQHRRLFAELEALRAPICRAAELMAEALHRGGRILLAGNGGSAADAQHLAAELNGRLKAERAPLAAMALGADGVTLTALANDYGYEQVFARQVLAQGRPGDCLVAISTSGESPNVLQALQTARLQGLVRVALLGRGGGRAAALADVAVVVPHDDTARIQEAHIFIGHTWCGQIESALGLVL